MCKEIQFDVVTRQIIFHYQFPSSLKLIANKAKIFIRNLLAVKKIIHIFVTRKLQFCKITFHISPLFQCFHPRKVSSKNTLRFFDKFFIYFTYICNNCPPPQFVPPSFKPTNTVILRQYKYYKL